jgi:hypothetical protein
MMWRTLTINSKFAKLRLLGPDQNGRSYQPPTTGHIKHKLGANIDAVFRKLDRVVEAHVVIRISRRQWRIVYFYIDIAEPRQ